MESHVGYNKARKVQLSARDHAAAGAVSGVVTRALLQPLDVLKIRFQLQVEPTRRGGGLYYGILQSLVTIFKNEGVTALWKGHLPAQALSVSYGIGQFGSYAIISKALSEYGVSQGICGGLAGICGTLLSMPFDVVRTRMIAQGTPKVYNGLMDGLVKMVQKEGLMSLWRGCLPTMAMSGPSSGLTFHFYPLFLNLTTNIFKEVPEASWFSCSAISGIGAGVMAKVCVYPFDVLKKRIQIRGFEDARKQFGKVVVYTDIFQYIATMMREEGASAWFKGLWPSLIKSGASTGVIFVSYEATCHFLVQLHNPDDKER